MQWIFSTAGDCQRTLVTPSERHHYNMPLRWVSNVAVAIPLTKVGGLERKLYFARLFKKGCCRLFKLWYIEGRTSGVGGENLYLWGRIQWISNTDVYGGKQFNIINTSEVRLEVSVYLREKRTTTQSNWYDNLKRKGPHFGCTAAAQFVCSTTLQLGT